MSLDSIDTRTVDHAIVRSATRRRITILAAFLAISAGASVFAGLLWPDSSDGDTYVYADLDSVRTLWWWLLNTTAVVAVLSVVSQAIATQLLVRDRGSAWADWGAGLMWLGITMQAVGLAGMAAGYYFASDPALGRGVSVAAFAAINADQGHLLGVLMPGALLAVIGQVLQAVGLLRSRAVPKWVPIASMCTLLTVAVPGNGVIGLVTSLPMTAAAVGIAFFAYKLARRPVTP